MNLFNLSFASPLWLLLGIPLLIAVVSLYLMGAKTRKRRLERIVAAHLQEVFTAQVSKPMRMVKTLLLIAALILLVLAVARPQLGYTWKESTQQTTDILFALDTSRSMLAPDLKTQSSFQSKTCHRGAGSRP
jgi:Ca-activated chloride channel family protein